MEQVTMEPTLTANIFWAGTLKIRELPAWCDTEEQYNLWLKLPEQEKERYTVQVEHNVLTLLGFAQLLSYIGSNNATTLGFSQYFSVGTSPIISVQAGDTGVAGEIFRAVPTSSSIVGNQLTLSTYFGPSSANGTYTNAGLWGVNATGTANSGTLMTHTLYTYIKVNGQAVSNDYLIVLQ